MKSSRLVRSLLAVSATLGVMVAGPSGATAATARWSVVPSPSPSQQANYLSSVDGIAANDAWAVGAWYRPIATPGTLTEHWDGSSWQQVASPNATAGYNELYGVSAVASNDVWAVGYHNISAYGSEKTMALHWDGSTWSIVRTQNLDQNANELLAVAAVGSNDVWAVGFGASTSNQVGKVLVEHWNGSAWSVVATPPLTAGFSELTGVAAVSSTDVWAVGSTGDAPLIEHWNGSAWTVIPGASQAGELYSVAASSSTDVWAVGEVEGGSGSAPLVEHWDGTSWTLVSAPSGTKPFTALTSVTAPSAADAWAVGVSYDPVKVVYRTFAVHWNGSLWATSQPPNPSTEYDSLGGVAVQSGTVWAVGAADIATLVVRTMDR